MGIVMKRILLKACVSAVAVVGGLVGTAAPAGAATILVFGQNGATSTITGTNDNLGTTTISGLNVAVTLTALENGALGTQAFLTLNASSTNAAVLGANNNINQAFKGTFAITSGLGGTGTNYLSGSFNDAVFGSGSGLVLQASSGTPPDVVNYSSSVITSLGSPRDISLSFTNVTPPVTIVNGSLSSFSASVAGNFSAAPTTPVPAPAGVVLALAALPGLGLGAWFRRKAAANAVA